MTESRNTTMFVIRMAWWIAHGLVLLTELLIMFSGAAFAFLAAGEPWWLAVPMAAASFFLLYEIVPIAAYPLGRWLERKYA